MRKELISVYWRTTSINLYLKPKNGDRIFVQIGNEQCYMRYENGKWYKVREENEKKTQNY